MEDCTGRLVLPGLVDLHVHASQFAYRGTGMDVEFTFRKMHNLGNFPNYFWKVRPLRRETV